MFLPLRLEIRHYETVAAVIEFGTMTEAARQLAITQSAMSHRLSEAEKRLGVSLFSRGADRRLTPTSHGLAVSQAAIRAMAELRRVERSITGSDASIEATVRLGVASYEAYGWFPSFRTRIRSERPEIELDLTVVDDHPASALASRQVDIVVAPGQPSGIGHLTPLFDDELVMICATDHPLAAADAITAPDLAAETYLTYNAQPSPGFEYDRFMRPSGQAPRVVRVVPQTSAIIELVAAGVGVSILSAWATRDVVAAGRLAAVRCGDGLPISWQAAHHTRDDHVMDVIAALRDHLRA